VTTERLSVILSTRNRAEILARAIESFARLDMTELLVEFIIVDNGSSDQTGEVIRQWSATLPILSWTVEQPGKNRCLNEAVRIATGNLLVFTDDDVIADRQWLQSLKHASLRWPEEHIFGGTVSPLFPAMPPSHVKILSRYYGELFSAYQPSKTEGHILVPPFGPNLMIRKAIFEQFSYDETIGPTDSCYAMGSETELLRRLQMHGFKYVFVPDAIVHHIIRPDQFNQSWLLDRAYRAGRGSARLRGHSSHHRRNDKMPWYLPIKWQARTMLSKANYLLGRRDAAFKAHWKARRAKGALHEYRARRESLQNGAT
jgi:glycosyltransferase involved in cell wall biosynthesis